MTAIVNHGIANARYAGVPVRLWSSGIPFLLSAGDGASNGLSFTGSAGGFTLSAAVIASTIAGLYVYLPANFGGSANAAGWYYATYNNDIIANIQNAGTLGRQINTRNGLSVGTGTTSVDGDIRAVDSSVNLTVSMTMQLPANTDSMICVFRQYTVNRA